VPQGNDEFIWYWPQNDDQFRMKFQILDDKVSGVYGEWLGELKKIS
jgi:hypothetical protein